MALPAAPSLVSEPKTTEQPEQEKASDGAAVAEPPSEDQEQSMEVEVTDNSKTETKGDVKNGSDDNSSSNTVENMDTSTEEVIKIKKEDIIAQV